MKRTELNRIEEAQAWAYAHGWTPLTDDERVEFMQAVADCTNL